MRLQTPNATGHRPAPAPSGADRSGHRGVLRAAGLGLITGAADDDPSAIGTYASAGARFGPAFLWITPILLPMMFTVVYLSAKLGQVTGRGLFAVLRKQHSSWLLYPTLAGVLIGNTIEAGADLGGIAAALNLLIPIPIPLLVVLVALALVAIQLWGSYVQMRNIFRVLALALLAYIPAAVLANPDLLPLLKATLVPTIRFDKEFLAMLVALIGATLSAYLYTWQSNEEVEEDKASGEILLSQRQGASEAELQHSRRDVLFGVFFANLALYFIILATGTALFKAGRTDINTAADAAMALQPLAGKASAILFALGVAGVGFLAVPVMTAGAAYDVCQSVGWKYGLNKRPAQAKRFYMVIIGCTLLAVGMNFLGFNPMKVLVVAGLVQGFSAPPLMLLIMRITNDRKVMGERVNGRALNILGWATTAVIFAAALGLVITSIT